MQRAASIIVSLVLALGPLAAAASAPVEWTHDTVIDLRFVLRDPKRIESYSCTRQGLVAVELGTRDGVMSPLWNWRIDDGRLQLVDDERVREEFTLIGMQDGTLTVRRRSGATAEFSYAYQRPKT